MRKEKGRKGGVKCPDECCWCLFTCFPLGKEQCFQGEVSEHPLAQLSSDGLCACLSASHPGAPCPSVCIKRRTLPGEEANRPNTSLLQAPFLGPSILPSPSGPGVLVCQKDCPTFSLSSAKEDVLMVAPSSCPSLHTGVWPRKWTPLG